MASKTNPDLQKERDKATFETELLTHVLDGGEFVTKRRRYIENLAIQDGAYGNNMDYHFMSNEQKYEDAIRRSAHHVKKVKELGLTDAADVYWYRSLANPNSPLPLGLHWGMFLPALRSQASEEQKKRWLPLCDNYTMIGTYAQTEMGHGTHVRGLETTATYDPKTEEFVVNSPTQTSLKWWPGGLGKTANHVVCMAQLHTRGQNHGIHSFLVPIRDTQTHQPLAGISVGDIGPKFGYESMDNGFLKFDHVRIPRENMLMKNSEVQRDGTYTSRAKSTKLTYGVMVFVRSVMISDTSAKGLGQACTIATRYSCVRRQSELQPGGPEPQIIDFQTQQYKLFPLIAEAYAYWFTGRKIGLLYFSVEGELQQGNLEMLPELHGLSAGLKAFTTHGMMAGVEQCRLACGGLGYSHASGIPKIYLVNVPGATFEGENTVMYLQCARYLMKVFQQASAGQKLANSVAYLSERNQHSKCPIAADFGLDSLVAAYKYRAANKVRKVGLRIQGMLSGGKAQYDASNLCAVDLVKAAIAHCHLFCVRTFVDTVNNSQDNRSVQAVLKQLCTMYALYGISQNSGDFLEDGYMSAQQLNLVNQKVLDLLSELRPNAVALVDAFDLPDHLLNSILGRYDGQVYENLYKWAQKSPLNKTQVHESYFKYLHPLKQSRL